MTLIQVMRMSARPLLKRNLRPKRMEPLPPIADHTRSRTIPMLGPAIVLELPCLVWKRERRAEVSCTQNILAFSANDL